MAKGARADEAGEVLDDVLFLVFERLTGFQDLLRCAATCKRWLRLVTDRVFLPGVGLWPETGRHPSVLVGIFSQGFFPSGVHQPLKREFRCPPQFLSLQAGGTHLNFDSFVANDDGLFNLARPMASRRGLLLLRIWMPTPDDPCGENELHLAVFRPLVSKQRSLLPPPPINGFVRWKLTGCALLTDEDLGVADDLDPQRQTFQVLLMYAESGGMHVYKYSSATNTWSAPIKCNQAPHLGRCGAFAGVVTHCNVHWMFTDGTSYYTLNLNTSTAHVSFTKIPINVQHWWGWLPIPCVTREGKLSFVSILDDGVLELWTKQEQDDGNVHGCEAGSGGWRRSDLINLGSDGEIKLIYFAERRGAMLIELDGGFFSIDLKSKEKTTVHVKGKEIEHVRGMHRFPRSRCSSSWCSGCPSGCVFERPVLYEVDWVFRGLGISSTLMFSTSCRLGGQMRADQLK